MLLFSERRASTALDIVGWSTACAVFLGFSGAGGRGRRWKDPSKVAEISYFQNLQNL